MQRWHHQRKWYTYGYVLTLRHLYYEEIYFLQHGLKNQIQDETNSERKLFRF